jgi:hypothetical protein
MKTNTKKYKILKQLAIGQTQSQIVKATGVDKSIVSRCVKEFIIKKWIKCIDPKAYCKTYRATPYAPITQREKKVNLFRSGRKTRIHNLCWSYKLLEQPRRKIHWDKIIKLKNNVTQKIIYFPLYTISLFEPKNKVLIWVKEEYTDDITKWEQVSKEHMLQAQAFLQKMFLCRLSLPELERETHFAKPIDDPTIMNVLKRQGILKFGDVWIDASKPGFEYGEIESTDISKLETMQKLQWSDLKIPERVNNIEKIMDQLTINVGKMAEAQVTTTEVIQQMQESIHQPKNYEKNSKNDQMFG